MDLHLKCKELAEVRPAQRVGIFASLAQDYGLVLPCPPQREIVERSISPGLTVVGRVQGVGPEDSAWLAEFALRMASDPSTLEAWASEHIDAGTRKLLEVPTLVRAARFLVLAVDKQKEHAIAGEFYAGWGWS